MCVCVSEGRRNVEVNSPYTWRAISIQYLRGSFIAGLVWLFWMITHTRTLALEIEI